MTKICIIIPALNEEKTIGNVIKLSSNYGNILVINDASNDGTKKIAIKNGATVLSNRSTLGYDQSILKGIKYALKKKYDYILTIDADGQHPIELIPKFIKYIEKGYYKIIVGNRKKFPRFSEMLFNTYSNFFHSIPDSLCGMKFYSTEVFAFLNKKRFLNSIGTYFLIEASRRKVPIKTINIDIKKRKYSNSKMGFSFFANFKILKAMLITIIHDIKYNLLHIK